MAQIYRQMMHSPLGLLYAESNGRAITAVYFAGSEQEVQKNIKADEVSIACIQQLTEYFEGNRKRFGLPMQLKGTEFQYHVWDALKTIDFGETISYMDLAKKINKPEAVRAVGTANGDNKIAILIPCHRVVGSNGKLTGYAAGLWRKQWLLEHEQKVNGKLLSLF